MKKKGFTLVELLAVIVILAIIITIAMTGFNSVSKRMKEKAYENLVKYIETKASVYANESKNLVTNVDNLIKLGYLDSDDEAGNIYDPRDRRHILNCHIVFIENAEGNYYGHFSDEENCETENVNLNISLKAFKAGTHEEIPENTWVNTNVDLKVVLKNDEPFEEIKWRTHFDLDNDNKNEYIVKVDDGKLINNSYFAKVRTATTSGEVSKQVKIDKEAPRVIRFSLSEEDSKKTWSNVKTLVLEMTDGNGSGLAGYYIKKLEEANETPTCSTVIDDYITNKKTEATYSVSENGKYYACVRDEAGNVSKEPQNNIITIDNIDTTKPTCNIETEERPNWVWYNGPKTTLVINGSDEGGSGVRSIFITQGWPMLALLPYNDNARPSMTWDTKSTTIVATIYDKAGNFNTCSIEIQRDATPPSCSLEITTNKVPGKNYYNKNVDVQWVPNSIKDDTSGIDKNGQYYHLENFKKDNTNLLPNIINEFKNINSITNSKSGNFITRGFVQDIAGNIGICDIEYTIKKAVPPVFAEKATSSSVCKVPYEKCCSGGGNCNCDLSNPSECTPDTMCCPTGQEYTELKCSDGLYLIGDSCYNCPEGTTFDSQSQSCKY